jgi:hypothetical protein
MSGPQLASASRRSGWQTADVCLGRKTAGRPVSDHLLMKGKLLQTLKGWLPLVLVLLPILLVLKALG